MQEKADKTILIAEDDETSFLLIEAVLASTNFNLIRVQNGQEALIEFEENKNISLILMDMKMPVLDGEQTTKIIRETNKTIPIIAQTAFALSGDKQIALNAGCNDYVTKPISRVDFLEKIHKYI